MSTLGISGATQYAIVTRDEDKRLAQFDKQPTVQQDIKRFTDAAPTIKSADDLLKNYRALQFVLTAFQLEDGIDQTAIIKQVLTQDPSDDKSLVNRLADPRYKQLASALQDWSSDPLSNQSTLDTIVKGYEQNAFEKDQGDQVDGMREALYFRRMIGQATSVPQIMSNNALLQVVRVGLGLPDSFGLQTYDQQKAMLTKRLGDLKQFQDPAYVDRFAQRYLINNEQQQGTSTDPIVSLFGGTGSGSATIDLTSLLGSNANLLV
jgi:hypothetical protein